jgi:hypothetical protein
VRVSASRRRLTTQTSYVISGRHEKRAKDALRKSAVDVKGGQIRALVGDQQDHHDDHRNLVRGSSLRE